VLPAQTRMNLATELSTANVELSPTLNRAVCPYSLEHCRSRRESQLKKIIALILQRWLSPARRELFLGAGRHTISSVAIPCRLSSKQRSNTRISFRRHYGKAYQAASRNDKSKVNRHRTNRVAALPQK